MDQHSKTFKWQKLACQENAYEKKALVYLLKFVKVYDWFRNPCHLSPNYIQIAQDILQSKFHQIEGSNLKHDFNDPDSCWLHRKLAPLEMELRDHIGSHVLSFGFSLPLHFFSLSYVIMSLIENVWSCFNFLSWLGFCVDCVLGMLGCADSIIPLRTLSKEAT